MRTRLHFAVRWIALLTLPLALLRCGEPIDHASDVRTLRVLAVSADNPFAVPGADVELRMLLHDGSPRAVRPDGTRRPVQVLWMGSCANPEGDLYYGCYPKLHQALAGMTDAELASETVPADMPRGTAGFGESFTLPVPGDIISGRPQASQVIHPYGIMYAFYAACAGVLRKVPSSDPTRDLPVGCFDPGTGEAVGSDDFDVGYYPVYAYTDVSNQNPGMSGVMLDRPLGATSCQDAPDCGAGEGCGSGGVCIPRVARCGAEDPDDCPSHALVPAIDAATLERAVTAHLTEQDAPMETFWVAYFSSGGSFAKDLRMVHEPGAGWQTGFEGQWRANVGSGAEVRLWAVLRDNRNGVAWAWQDVLVE